jgi:6-phospho-beta-glucosidase
MRLLPTEYLYYYYRPDIALAHMRRAGSSRGAAVSALTASLFEDLSRGADDPLARYERYLADRDGTYMQLETGVDTRRTRPDWAELSGYDRIALMTMRAIVHDQGAMIPLDVANRRTLPFLGVDDIVEVPCRVDAAGPRPQSVAPVPEHARDLITRVKTYERATVRAALTGQRKDQIEALALNPLVRSRDLAARLVDELLSA